VELGARLGLADPDVLAYCWVHRFPMYQWDAENGRWDATHNPFSGVLAEDEALLVTASGDPSRPSPDDPAGRARALQYDIALNGWELGGGSVRIHRRELLAQSFALQGQTDEGMREKFGAILDAFDYGAPPHGGIALGIDRWAALFADQTNIREVMAFPKTQSGGDLMLDAPSPPETRQYEELGLRFVGMPGREKP
jgi:aspartyl-tRNA synthetase